MSIKFGGFLLGVGAHAPIIVHLQYHAHTQMCLPLHGPEAQDDPDWETNLV